ncbi:hypothetical protein K3495_g12390 [Podosphaera aphanis]|nr:hypothetical protein K3495_g12390 [Podosphaera aphanis]
MTSLPKNFLRGIDPENMIPESRRQSPQKKGKHVLRSESPTSPPLINELDGSPLSYSPYDAPPTSYAPYETPLPRSHLKLPSKTFNTPLYRQNTLDSIGIASLIQNQLTTTFENFSLKNDANLFANTSQYNFHPRNLPVPHQ